jgi:hypothetical protein
MSQEHEVTTKSPQSATANASNLTGSFLYRTWDDPWQKLDNPRAGTCIGLVFTDAFNNTNATVLLFSSADCSDSPFGTIPPRGKYEDRSRMARSVVFHVA